MEITIFDKIINYDLYKNNLLDDVHKDNELKNGLKNNNEPTLVTLASVRDEKKHRNISHESLKVLIDTGCSHSLLSKEHCKKLISQKEKSYATGNGMLKTNYKSKIIFSLREFIDKKIITWTFNVADKESLGYDMILGRDLLMELKMNVSFNRKIVTWEETEIPMRDFNKLRKHNLNKKEF